MVPRLDEAAVARLYRRANAGRWQLPVAAFAEALQRCVDRDGGDAAAGARDVERRLASLHLEDLALACACALAIEAAWDHFVTEYRPILYRAADAIDPGGHGREIADSIYGELFGLTEKDGVRRSHFDYFFGRSSLSTWLRAVLAQRHVDRLRATRRLEPLPGDESPHAVAAAAAADSQWPRYLDILRRALSAAVGALDARDRLRLHLYYAEELTLAQIGNALKEHEATVSRGLARTRKTLRAQVEGVLRDRERLSESEIAECFAAAVRDSGPLDLSDLLGGRRRKNLEPDRST
jgi:RNA polymerase sigma-70 factor (ECF subfamily)